MQKIKQGLLQMFYTLLAAFGIDQGSVTADYVGNSNMVLMELQYGTVVIELYPDIAPNHVKRIKELVKAGFYNGLKFHRVIDDFMVQTGDPNGDGTGGSTLPNLKAEFSDLKHVRGVLSMARSADVNSANSQFFIMLGDSPHLDGQYTAFGKVVSGMEFIDMIKKGDTRMNGKVDNPDSIIRMRIAGIENDNTQNQSELGGESKTKTAVV